MRRRPPPGPRRRGGPGAQKRKGGKGPNDMAGGGNYHLSKTGFRFLTPHGSFAVGSCARGHKPRPLPGSWGWRSGSVTGNRRPIWRPGPKRRWPGLGREAGGRGASNAEGRSRRGPRANSKSRGLRGQDPKGFECLFRRVSLLYFPTDFALISHVNASKQATAPISHLCL